MVVKPGASANERAFTDRVWKHTILLVIWGHFSYT